MDRVVMVRTVVGHRRRPRLDDDARRALELVAHRAVPGDDDASRARSSASEVIRHDALDDAVRPRGAGDVIRQ
jgi:hypothetical protein